MMVETNAHFHLPSSLEAGEPAEERGIERDEVKLMVSNYSTNNISHTTFYKITDFLSSGDVVVINTSKMRHAAVEVRNSAGKKLKLHFSNQIDKNLWIVELRIPAGISSQPFLDAQARDIVHLNHGGSVRLIEPYNRESKRLWKAVVWAEEDYLEKYGEPIYYQYQKQKWPAHYYQNVYANEVGSAEMPSAGRAFTAEMITKLIAQGVQIVPIVLHTGVSSLEEGEKPYREFYRVPDYTANAINYAYRKQRKIIAVGTTVVRAIETVANEDHVVLPGEGWTSLVISPTRKIRVINAMLTGMHEPNATHLAMLEALAGREHVKMCYDAAIYHQYLWHEFGDLHLLHGYTDEQEQTRTSTN